MNRLALSTTLGLALVGCAHSVPVAQRLQEEEQKCALLRMVLREPQPTQEMAAFASEGREPPVPVMVFVRKPDQAMLERFFVGESPECEGDQFRVVRTLGREGLVVYLQETGSGYSYDAHRSGPEELSMVGTPQGVVRRGAEGGWVAASD